MIHLLRLLLFWESWSFLVLVCLVLLLLDALAFLVFRTGVLLVVKLELLFWRFDWACVSVRLLRFVKLRDIIIMRLTLSQMYWFIYFSSMFYHNILVICISFHHFFPLQLTDWRWCELHWAWWISSHRFQVVDLLWYGRHAWSWIHLMHQWHDLLFKVLVGLLKLWSGNHSFSILCHCIMLRLNRALAMWHLWLRWLLRWDHLWFAFFYFTACFASSLLAPLFIHILIVIFEVFQLHKCNLSILRRAHQILIDSRQLAGALGFNHVPRLKHFLFLSVSWCQVPYNCLVIAMGFWCLVQCLESAWFHHRDVSSKIWLAFLKDGLNVCFFTFAICRCARATALLFLVSGLGRECRLMQVIRMTHRGVVLHINELWLRQFVVDYARLVWAFVLRWIHRIAIEKATAIRLLIISGRLQSSIFVGRSTKCRIWLCFTLMLDILDALVDVRFLRFNRGGCKCLYCAIVRRGVIVS